MSDDAKVPLPPAAVDEHNLQGGRLLYTHEQMRAYGDARERAARAAEREALIAEADATVDKLRALHRTTMGYEDACVARGAELVADALRARAEGDGEGGR